MPPRILILDAQESVRAALALIVQHAGMDSSVAATTADALTLAEQTNFDLLILDHSPGVNGLEFLPVWKRTHPSTPVVLISAGFENAHDRAHHLGAATCIAKPFRSEQLLAALHATIATLQT